MSTRSRSKSPKPFNGTTATKPASNGISTVVHSPLRQSGSAPPPEVVTDSVLATSVTPTVSSLSAVVEPLVPSGFFDYLDTVFRKIFDQLTSVAITPSGPGTRGATSVTMRSLMESMGIIDPRDLYFIEPPNMARILDIVSHGIVKTMISTSHDVSLDLARQKLTVMMAQEAEGSVAPSTTPVAAATAPAPDGIKVAAPRSVTDEVVTVQVPVTGPVSKRIGKRAPSPGVTFSPLPMSERPANTKGAAGGSPSYKDVVTHAGAGVTPSRKTGELREPFPPLKSLLSRGDDGDDDDDDSSSGVSSPRSDKSSDDSSLTSIHPVKHQSPSGPSTTTNALYAAAICSMRDDWRTDETLNAIAAGEAAAYGQGLPFPMADGSIFFLKIKSNSSGKTARQFLVNIGGPDGVPPTPLIGVAGRQAFHPFPSDWQGVMALHAAMEKSIVPSDLAMSLLDPRECLRRQKLMKDFHADHLTRMRQIAGVQDPWLGHPHNTCFHTFFSCMLVYWATVRYCIGVLGQPEELRDTLRTMFNMATAQGCFTKEIDQISLRGLKAMLILTGVMCGVCRRPGCTEMVCPTCGVNAFGKAADKKTTDAEAKTNADRKAAIMKWQSDPAHKERATLSGREAYRQWTKAPEGVAFAAAHRTGVSSRSTSTTTKPVRLTEEEALLVHLKNSNKLAKPFSLLPISRL